MVRLRKVQVVNDEGEEEAAIAAHWVTDGVDRCRVGFLDQHCIRHYKRYKGKLAQVVSIYGEDDNSP